MVFLSATLTLFSQASFGSSMSSPELQRTKTSSQRIINGVEAKKEAYPFVIGLISSSTSEDGEISPFCGASFIGGHYVLTASHCVDGSVASGIDVIVGEHDLKDRTSGVRYKVAQIYMHEDYDGVATNNDIAILELENAITNVTPIKPLPPELESLLKVGDLLTVMGWGNMSIDGYDFPTVLQEVQVPLYDREKCNTAYSGGITDVMLCAGFEQGGKDSCQGDSGGPLVIKKNDEWYQAGVVSFGEGCASPDFPGVYARVSKFIDWIKQKKAGVSYQQKPSAGYVESNYEDVISFAFKNLSSTEYGITAIEFTDLTKVAQPSIITNNCNSAAIKQGESCEFTVKVTSTELGQGGFNMKVHTTHPGNSTTLQYFSINSLEKSNLDMKSLLDINNDNIEWYSGGDQVWQAQTTKVLKGNNAIESGDITDLQNSVLLAVIKDPRATDFSFNYLVQAEDSYDGLKMTINGQPTEFFATGTEQTEYKLKTIELKQGTDRIAFLFFKDETDEDPVGFNKAYIDLVQSTFINSAPIIKLTQTDFTVKVTEELIFDASKSEDADGDTISYKWQLIGDELGSTLVNSTTDKATFIAGNEAGKVTFKVTSTDQYGATSSQTGSVTISQDKKKSAGAGGFLFIFSLLFLSLRVRKS